MCHIVTSRFVDCVNQLKDQSVISSYRSFAQSVDVSPQSLNEILKKKRNVSVDLIAQSAERYHINVQYLYTGIGEPFINPNQEVIDLDSELSSSITYVPIAAQAGYGGQIHNAVMEKDLPTFSLPGYEHKMGEHCCFDIAGDSMEPSLFSGDKVVCSLVDQDSWQAKIKDGLVYIIVTEDSLYAKRVCNDIKLNHTLELLSDNTYYKPFSLAISEIKEIWQVELTISMFNASPKSIKTGVYDQVEGLKTMLASQTETIQTLNMTIERLCKSSRSRN